MKGDSAEGAVHRLRRKGHLENWIERYQKRT
jgi:hypothetical protein